MGVGRDRLQLLGLLLGGGDMGEQLGLAGDSTESRRVFWSHLDDFLLEDPAFLKGNHFHLEFSNANTKNLSQRYFG